MNSTETPGGSGIPAGWYDDPSGGGLRWWDGEQWTEHVHTAESAAAASAPGTGAGGGSREGAPPRDLVKLRESIRRRGTKGVGIVLGGIVLVLVVIGLLVAGGSEGGGSGELHLGQPGQIGNPGSSPAAAKRIRQINRQLKNKKLSGAKRKRLLAQKRVLQRSAGKAVQKRVEAAQKAAEEALENAE